MASTKDITSVVTSNMRKHLAKQKWKVIVSIRRSDLTIIDRADYAANDRINDIKSTLNKINERFLCPHWQYRGTFNKIVFSKRSTPRPLFATCSGWSSTQNRRMRTVHVQIVRPATVPQRKLAPIRIDESLLTHASSTVAEIIIKMRRKTSKKNHRGEYFCSRTQHIKTVLDMLYYIRRRNVKKWLISNEFLLKRLFQKGIRRRSRPAGRSSSSRIGRTHRNFVLEVFRDFWYEIKRFRPQRWSLCLFLFVVAI